MQPRGPFLGIFSRIALRMTGDHAPCRLIHRRSEHLLALFLAAVAVLAVDSDVTQNVDAAAHDRAGVSVVSHHVHGPEAMGCSEVQQEHATVPVQLARDLPHQDGHVAALFEQRLDQRNASSFHICTNQTQ